MDFDNLSTDDDFHTPLGGTFAANLARQQAQQQAAAAQQGQPAFNQMDQDVASLISSLGASQNSPTQLGSSARPFNNGSSSYAGSDADSDRLSNPFSGLNKDSLSVISAPYLNRGGIKHNLFASASIAGHVITQASPFDAAGSRAPPPAKGSNFLDKFGSVAERTRELESGLAGFSMDESAPQPAGQPQPAPAAAAAAAAAQPQERRASFLGSDAAAPYNYAVTSSPASLNEPLHSSRHQSVSDRIDSYQQEQVRKLSFSSEVMGSESASATGVEAQPIKHNIWNPASAHTFQPSGQPAAAAAPAAAAPPPFSQFPQHPFMLNNGMPAPMFPNMYSPFSYQQAAQAQAQAQAQAAQFPGAGIPLDENAKSGASPDSRQDPDESAVPGAPNSARIPGVNLLNRSMSPQGFMIPPPFVPYGMFPQMGMAPAPVAMSPPGPSDSSSSKTPTQGSAAYGNPVPPLNLRETLPAGPAAKNGNGNGNGNGKRSPYDRRTPESHSAPSQAPSQQNSKASRSKNGAPFIQRSPLLEEFRSNPTGKEYRLSDIYGHGIEFSKDQHGSRFIQAQLSKSTEEEKEVIFNEIRDFAYDLISDVFGNYVIQKYFEFGNDTQRKVLLDTMESHIRELSLQMYGCRVVQRAIEYIEVDAKKRLVSELDQSSVVLECCKDANGNHVIQKAIELVPVDSIAFIFESIKDQVYHLSTNSFGCRVIQKLLEFGKEDQCRFIVQVLEKYVDVLLVDKFGNYVVQYILTNNSNCDTTEIVGNINKTIMTDFTRLSANKFSSNVVESFIIATPLSKRLKIKEATMEDDNVKLIQLINDPYGNYVIQKLVIVDADQKDHITSKFVTSIKEYLENTGSSNSKASIEKLRNIIKSI